MLRHRRSNGGNPHLSLNTLLTEHHNTARHRQPLPHHSRAGDSRNHRSRHNNGDSLSRRSSSRRRTGDSHLPPSRGASLHRHNRGDSRLLNPGGNSHSNQAASVLLRSITASVRPKA